MDLISRNYYLNKCQGLFKRYPVLAILGPRQCGKTTFVKSNFSEFDYLDLELPSDFSKIEMDPELYLSTRNRPTIIDEAQRFPKLFPILRSLVDQNRKKYGRFILLGSASFQLQSQLNESLSGRIAFVDLTPLQLPEVYPDIPIHQRWLKGGFPDALLSGENHAVNIEWFDFYTRTLIERDLPSLGIEIDRLQFRKLWMMCVHFNAQVLNMNKIAGSLGISPHTVNRYINILEQTFVMRRLSPYTANLKKRLIKSPKLFFRDSGLLHYFARIRNEEELLTSPERGASFESLVVEYICQNIPEGWDACFFRTSDDIECDLILTTRNKVIPLEIKAKLSIHKNEVKALHKVKALLKADQAYFVYLGQENYTIAQGIQVLSLQSLVATAKSSVVESLT